MRLKKYLTCYIRQCRTGCFEKFYANHLVPLEYHFDAHEHCNASWCWQKHLDDVLHQQLQQINSQRARGEELVPPVDDEMDRDETINVESEASNDAVLVGDAIDEEYDAFETKWMECLGYGGEVAEDKDDEDEDFNVEYEYDELIDGDEDGLDPEVDEEGRHTIRSIEGIMGDFNISTEAFGEGVLETLKLKEMELVKIRECGYYRCKHKHAVVYGKIAEAISPYLTRERLMELHHNFHTQKNESMNQSVSSYAPKTKTHSKTKSLEARVSLAAAIDIAGYEKVWRRIFNVFSLDLDDNLASVLKTMDEEK